MILLLLLVAVGGCDRQNRNGQQGDAAAGPVKGVDRGRAGRPVADAAFTAPDGTPTSLAALRGRPLLVNMWATWCAPCVKELPTLDKLARAHSADGRLAILAISQDRAPQGSVEAFLRRVNATSLAAWHDPQMTLSAALSVEVLPTTILIDDQGREVWRYVGDLDWTGEEARALLGEIGKP